MELMTSLEIAGLFDFFFSTGGAAGGGKKGKDGDVIDAEFEESN